MRIVAPFFSFHLKGILGGDKIEHIKCLKEKQKCVCVNRLKEEDYRATRDLVCSSTFDLKQKNVTINNHFCHKECSQKVKWDVSCVNMLHEDVIDFCGEKNWMSFQKKEGKFQIYLLYTALKQNQHAEVKRCKDEKEELK